MYILSPTGLVGLAPEGNVMRSGAAKGWKTERTIRRVRMVTSGSEQTGLAVS
jgi:hypothetical protein